MNETPEFTLNLHDYPMGLYILFFADFARKNHVAHKVFIR